MFIKPLEPFSLRQTLRFILSPPALLNGRQFPPLLDYFEEGEYRRVVEIGAQQVLCGVSEETEPQGPGDRPGPPAGGRSVLPRPAKRLRVRILSGPEDSATAQALRKHLERQFSTSLDLNPFYKLAESDTVLAKLVAHFRGMRVPQAPTVFESVVCAILEQQVNLSFAHQVKKSLIETYGRSVEHAGRRYNAFPEPAALAIATPRELRRLQISGPKAHYIIALSRAVLDGSLDLEGLRDADPPTAHARLLERKGVGPWTAQYVGLRALGHADCLPAADVGLQKALRDFYGLRKMPSAARVEKIARAWAGWRSYATFYFWLTYWENPEWKNQLVAQLRAARGKT